MRLEIRKSGDDEIEGLRCDKCGATELIATKEGDDLSYELAILIEQEMDERLGPLWDEFSRRIERERAALADVLADITTDLGLARAQLSSFEDTVTQGLRGLTAETVPGWRRLKLRRQEKLRVRLEEIIDAMRVETRRV